MVFHGFATRAALGMRASAGWNKGESGWVLSADRVSRKNAARTAEDLLGHRFVTFSKHG
jgi:hypothetical protein